MTVVYLAEKFKSKRAFKKAVEAGRQLRVSRKQDEFVPIPISGDVIVMQPGGFMTDSWIATKVDVADGVVTRVYGWPF